MGEIIKDKPINGEVRNTPIQLIQPILSSKESRFKINKETLPLKLTLFLYCGAMSAILPYLTIHMQEIGITIEETAIIYAVLPFTSFIGPPLMGFLADKLGQYKIVLIMATIVNGIFHTLLLSVPVYKETHLNSPISLNWMNSTEVMSLSPSDTALCEPFQEAFIQPQELIPQTFHCNASHSFEGIANQVHCIIEIVEHAGDRIYELTCYDPFMGSESQIIESIQQFPKIMIKGIEDCSLELNMRISSEFSYEFVTCGTNLTFSSILVKGNNASTFWTYFILRIIATMFMSSCFTLLDALALAYVKKTEKAEYGKERIWSVLGFGAISPLAGLLVDKISRSKGYTDYSSAFYLSNVLLLCNIVTYLFVNLQVEKPEEGFGKNAQKLLRYPEVVAFLIMIFVLGTMYGFVESYLFIFLKELEAPNYLLGLTLTVGAIAGVPFSYGSEKILTRFGRVNIIIFAFFVYFVRFFGYSYITSPFWCFPFEAMEAFTFHTMWIAAATYCSELAPKGLLATLMGVMGSLHYSLGKGNGAFIGGYLMGSIGTRLSFRYFGIAAGITGVIYLTMSHFWLQKVVRRRHDKEYSEASTEDQEKDNVKKDEIKTKKQLNGDLESSSDLPEDAALATEVEIMLPRIVN